MSGSLSYKMPSEVDILKLIIECPEKWVRVVSGVIENMHNSRFNISFGRPSNYIAKLIMCDLKENHVTGFRFEMDSDIYTFSGDKRADAVAFFPEKGERPIHPQLFCDSYRPLASHILGQRVIRYANPANPVFVTTTELEGIWIQRSLGTFDVLFNETLLNPEETRIYRKNMTSLFLYSSDPYWNSVEHFYGTLIRYTIKDYDPEFTIYIGATVYELDGRFFQSVYGRINPVTRAFDIMNDGPILDHAIFSNFRIYIAGSEPKTINRKFSIKMIKNPFDRRSYRFEAIIDEIPPLDLTAEEIVAK